MTSNSFEVKNYEVQIQPHPWWKDIAYDIHLEGPRVSGDVQHGAALFFVPSDPEDEGEVEIDAEYSESGGGHQVTGFLHVDFFDRIYRVLQTEDPVTFYYTYEWGDADHRDLFSFQLLTSDEPLGEGLRDAPPGVDG